MREYKCLVDEETANEFFAMPSIEFDRHIRIRTIGRDGTLTMRFIDNEQPKPRTKTEYPRVNESIFELKGEFDRGELYSNYVSGDGVGYDLIEDEASLAFNYSNNSLHRKVEKEIDWREEVNDFFLKAEALGTDHLISNAIEMKELGSDFIAMCRLVESLTRHIEIQ